MKSKTSRLPRYIAYPIQGALGLLIHLALFAIYELLPAFVVGAVLFFGVLLLFTPDGVNFVSYWTVK